MTVYDSKLHMTDFKSFDQHNLIQKKLSKDSINVMYNVSELCIT